MGSLQNEYSANRNEKWMQKVSLLNLLITVSATNYSFKNGASDLTISREDLLNYIQSVIMPELTEQDCDNLPLLKATCIKFVYMFRSFLPPEYLINFLQLFCNFLKSQYIVNQSYAAACIEKLLVIKQAGGKENILNKQNVSSDVVSGLLQNMCALLNEQRNLHAVRALYRIVSLAEDTLHHYSGQLSKILAQFILEIAKDDSDLSPNYVYVLFETCALTIKLVSGPDQKQELEQNLQPALNFILENNKTDLMSFAFQIYSLFVSRASANSPLFEAIFQSMIHNQSNWGKDMKYLIPSMGHFLISMICKFPEYSAQHASSIGQIVKYLMSVEVRAEVTALEIGSALFERVQTENQSLLKEILFSIFTSMHFYKNNTKNQTVPQAITRQVFAFFATIMVVSSP
jgi:exportin-2 (importin alpha re-exporter)